MELPSSRVCWRELNFITNIQETTLNDIHTTISLAYQLRFLITRYAC